GTRLRANSMAPVPIVTAAPNATAAATTSETAANQDWIKLDPVTGMVFAFRAYLGLGPPDCPRLNSAGQLECPSSLHAAPSAVTEGSHSSRFKSSGNAAMASSRLPNQRSVSTDGSLSPSANRFGSGRNANL